MTKTKAVVLLLSVLCALVTYFLLHNEEDEESRLATNYCGTCSKYKKPIMMIFGSHFVIKDR
jgi:hypothetical protein